MHIWTFKSKYANRCLLSKSIIKLDFTWVRKILFPSLCICHLEITFHFRRQPYGLWLGRVSEKGEYPIGVRWAHAFQIKVMPPSLRMWNANETDHYFSLLNFRSLRHKCLTHSEFTLLLYDSAWIWHMRKSFPNNLVEYLMYLADFSSVHRWNKVNDILLEGFSQIHMLNLVAITHNFFHSDQLLTAE